MMRPLGMVCRTVKFMALELANDMIGRCGLVIRLGVVLPLIGSIDYTLLGRLALVSRLLSSSVDSGADGVGPTTMGVLMVTVGVIPRVIRPSGKPNGVTVRMGLRGKCWISVT